MKKSAFQRTEANGKKGDEAVRAGGRERMKRRQGSGYGEENEECESNEQYGCLTL